jgi:ParB/RepB/Spo0J family partition protein
MATTVDDKRKRIHRSGALGLVLAEAEAQEKSPPPALVTSTAAPATTGAAQRVGQRYFPTKGYGRVPANVCRPWRLADRPADEFSHTKALAESMAANGQVQPALVRLCHDPKQPDIRYEVIAGVARWRSALNSGSELDIQIRELTDQQAYRAMVAENEDRQNLSDYARAKRFARALEEGVVANKTELAELARLSATQLSYFLGFASLPDRVVTAMADVRAVSMRMGYAMSTACREGFEFELTRDMSRLESGEIARDRIPAIWREERDRAASTGSGHPPPPPKVVGVVDDVAGTVERVTDDSGAEICRIRRSAGGAMTWKLAARVGKRLSAPQIKRIVEILKETPK